MKPVVNRTCRELSLEEKRSSRLLRRPAERLAQQPLFFGRVFLLEFRALQLRAALRRRHLPQRLQFRADRRLPVARQPLKLVIPLQQFGPLLGRKLADPVQLLFDPRAPLRRQPGKHPLALLRRHVRELLQRRTRQSRRTCARFRLRLGPGRRRSRLRRLRLTKGRRQLAAGHDADRREHGRKSRGTNRGVPRSGSFRLYPLGLKRTQTFHRITSYRRKAFRPKPKEASAFPDPGA